MILVSRACIRVLDLSVAFITLSSSHSEKLGSATTFEIDLSREVAILIRVVRSAEVLVELVNSRAENALVRIASVGVDNDSANSIAWFRIWSHGIVDFRETDARSCPFCSHIEILLVK